MSLEQYYPYEQNLVYGLSAGTINDFDFFNIHSGRQQHEEESNDAKVINILI